MQSGRSRLLLLLLLVVVLVWGAFALGSHPPSELGLFEGGCSTFPKDSDRCGEPKPRFFYNSTSERCEPFIYRGCPWNHNRYYTVEECQRHCGQIEKPGFCPPSPTGVTVECLADCLHDGNCLGTEKCCSHGCALRCLKPVTDLCQLPPEHGPCDSKIQSWFYDSKTRRCKRFTFGGCLGNKNNFKRRGACQRSCLERGSS
ncbi:BPTI/Kunitz domain-containing protein-like [Liasis olivaceus]